MSEPSIERQVTPYGTVELKIISSFGDKVRVATIWRNHAGQFCLKSDLIGFTKRFYSGRNAEDYIFEVISAALVEVGS